MLERALTLTREYRLLPPGSPVLCAVSGGADSVCLLAWLREQGVDLHAAHFDHRLRGEESQGDAAFVEELCRDWSVPFRLGGGDVAAFAKKEGLTVEEAARRLRYAFLEEEGAGLGPKTVVAVAHTADDNAETLLWNLVRGTGLKGLGGIPPDRPLGRVRLVRPFLTTTRAEIEEWLTRRGLPHREDSTNGELKYTRNRLRRQVMPVLRELNPRAAEKMAETARQLRELDLDLDRQAEELLTAARWQDRDLTFPLPLLRGASPSLGPRVVQGLLDRLGVGKKDFGAVHLTAILTLKPGGRLDLPTGVGVRAKGGLLILTQRDPHYNPRERGEGK